MISREEFLELVRDELAVPVPHSGTDDLAVDLKSLQVLQLVRALERVTGQRLPVGSLMEERSLNGIYQRVVELTRRH